LSPVILKGGRIFLNRLSSLKSIYYRNRRVLNAEELVYSLIRKTFLEQEQRDFSSFSNDSFHLYETRAPDEVQRLGKPSKGPYRLLLSVGLTLLAPKYLFARNLGVPISLCHQTLNRGSKPKGLGHTPATFQTEHEGWVHPTLHRAV